LPLNLIALIVAQIQDPGDLARVCRTSRLLYYMTLPQLYQHVRLHSYDHIRYVHGRPEGFGGGSPFIMALNGFVTNSHAAIVQDFCVYGRWREAGVEDFAKGRVPDNSMMLNILLRAATDKMTRLRSFSWELDSKPLKPLYQGLTTHATLTSLTIKFPSARIPRPTVLIPPIPSLRAFRAIDIDPLCYPDDISLLLSTSPNLRDLRLHFSPRMRQAAEPTLSLQTYFGQCWKANYLPPLRHFALQNFFGHKAEGLDAIFDPETLESATFLDTFGGLEGEGRHVFVDSTWRDLPRDMAVKCRVMRCNEVDELHAELIGRSRGLEGFFVVGARSRGARVGISPEGSAGVDQDPPPLPPPPPSTSTDPSMLALGSTYLSALTTSHGATLRHLLLSPHWALTPSDISNIVRYCPHLTQLGLATNSASPHYLRLLMPFLPKLQALRVLENEFTREYLRVWEERERVEFLGRVLAGREAEGVRVVGVGDVLYVLG
ncbi:hypothetical protein EJ03DRAFT_249984, partial [Teratosphaeria nubilosa]